MTIADIQITLVDILANKGIDTLSFMTKLGEFKDQFFEFLYECNCKDDIEELINEYA